MKQTLQSSAGVKVRIAEFEDADILAFVSSGKVSTVTEATNADRRQKVALVAFRADLSALIGEGDDESNIKGLGFKRLTKNVTRGSETEEVWGETEGDHIDRFETALAQGHFHVHGFTLPSGDDKAKQKAANEFLQKLAFQCGDKTDDQGNKYYELSLDRPVRTGTGNLVPKWAKDAATTIINNGSESKWADKFRNGYVNPQQITIDAFAFEDFMVVASDNATPEEKEAVRQKNINRLGRALVAVDKQVKAKTVAAEFV